MLILNGVHEAFSKNSRANGGSPFLNSALNNPEPRPDETQSRFFAIPRFKPQGEVSLKEVGNEVAILQPVSQISEAIEKCGANPSLKLFLPPLLLYS